MIPNNQRIEIADYGILAGSPAIGEVPNDVIERQTAQIFEGSE